MSQVSASTFGHSLLHMHGRILNDYREHYGTTCSGTMHLKTKTSVILVQQSASHDNHYRRHLCFWPCHSPSIVISLLTYSLSSLSRSFFCPLQILPYSVPLTFCPFHRLCRPFYPATFSNFLRFSHFRRSSSCDRLRIPAPRCRM